MNIGNGGAGPYYGFFRLGETDDGFHTRWWKEDDGFVGTLSKPFPHLQPWNDLTGQPEDSLGDRDEQEYEQQFERFEQRYYSSDLVDGAIPICHIGCALRIWLVLTGPEFGNLWFDKRADYEGLMPVTGRVAGLTRVKFLDWYEEWLADSEKASTVTTEAAPMEEQSDGRSFFRKVQDWFRNS